LLFPALRTVLKDRPFGAKAIVYVCFCATRAVARIFPLHLPVVLERRRFWGGVSELEGHLPVLEGLRGAWRRELLVALERSVAALGRPLA
jgi:hypothetical protein